jgi:hypothetical protein
MSRPIRRFPHDRYLSSRRLEEHCYATQPASAESRDIGNRCGYRLREALARSCGFFLWLALIRAAGATADAEAISPIADQFLAARFCMSSSTGAVGQQSTLSLFAF